LGQTYKNFKEKQIVAHIEFDKEKQSLIVEIQDLKGQYEIAKVQLSKPNPILPTKMNIRLKELLLDNTLLKVHNQALGDKTPSGRSGGKLFKNS
jgi:hypothetical protein